ncbi:MAG: ankyrin repeat domain-containing protein [Chthoniobacterales bacterium]|nr:ankyrin repeat domain-containing protein [Chthoniobacterales bacterium]
MVAAKGIATKSLLAGALLLQAYSFAPEPHAPSQLPPDSLVRAVTTNNPLLLEHSFAEGVDVNGAAPDGRTALLAATLQGDHQLIERLLHAGANVDLADQSGTTPIMVAAERGDMQLLQKFLSRTKRPDAADASGRAAVHRAFEHGQLEAADVLIALMPAVDVAGPDGRDLVTMACDAERPEIIRAVLQRAPESLQWTSSSRRALTNSLSAGDAELTRLLLSKYAGPPTVEGRSIPLLAHAIAIDDRGLVEALLQAGADPNVVLPAGADKEFLALLGSASVRDYVKGDDGVTPLMIAAGLGKPEYVRALLDAGAQKNRITTRYKMMALYFAARTDQWRAVQMLIGSGTEPEKLRIEISLASQRAAVFKDGTQVFQTAVSTGRPGFSTPAGQYVITDKNRSHKSSIYHVEMPFFMRLNCRDFGLHAGAVPNYPASHGCIRLPSDVAQKFFSEIPVGTVVMIN